MWILTNPHLFLTIFLGLIQRDCKPNESIIEQNNKMFESRISAGAKENTRMGKNVTRTLEDSKSDSGSVLCILEVEHLFQSARCARNKLPSHSSAESESISLDAEFRMDGLSTLDLWEIVIEILRSTNNIVEPNVLASMLRLTSCNWDHTHEIEKCN